MPVQRVSTVALCLAAACFDCGGRSELLGSELRKQAEGGSTSQRGGQPAVTSGGSATVSSGDGGVEAYGGAAGAAEPPSAGQGAVGQGGVGEDGGAAGASASSCGNGVVEQEEWCDDGNASSGDSCKECVGIEHIALGEMTTCAILSDGSPRCFGQGLLGALGLEDPEMRGDEPGEMGDALPAPDLGASGVVALAGGYQTCALFDSGAVKCWGSNYRGALGLGLTAQLIGDEPGEMGQDLPFVDVGAPLVAIDAGTYHTCGLLQGGSVKCWGYGEFGQLGLGDFQNRGDGEPAGVDEMGANLPVVDLGAKATAIALGLFHTCALLEGGSVKCWGYNLDGQLGQGDTDMRGVVPDEMGTNLAAIELGASALAVAPGYYHTCALLDGGSVKCWGSNSFAQLGLGLPADDNRGDAPGEMGSNLPAVELGASAVSIGAGAIHTCALLVDGRVKCWGFNGNGRLGLGDLENRGDDPSEMGANLPAVELGQVNVTRLVVGPGHQCVMTDTHQVKCWGMNAAGQLGLGETGVRGDTPSDMGALLPVTPLP